MSLRKNWIIKIKAETAQIEAELEKLREELDYCDDHNDPHRYGIVAEKVMKLIKKQNELKELLKQLMEWIKK